MAKVRGTDGIVKVGGNTVASVVRFELTQSMEPIENTDLGTDAKDYASGDTEWNASVDCRWDKADTTGQGAMTIGAEVTVTLQPEGDTTGDETRSGSALVVGISGVNEKGSMVTQNFTLQGKGDLTIGAVA